jgi:hypothetical protein
MEAGTKENKKKNYITDNNENIFIISPAIVKIKHPSASNWYLLLTKYVVGANTSPPKNPSSPPKNGKVMPMNIVITAYKSYWSLKNKKRIKKSV